MFNLKSRLLTLGLVTVLVTASPTSTAEVDVIFPRNNTFVPMPLMPVVFAVQNPAAVEQLYPSLWYKVSSLESPTQASSEDLDIRGISTNDTTVFLYNGIANLLNTEGTWQFSWMMRWINCSTSDNGTAYKDDDTMEDVNGFHRRTSLPFQSFIFTTGKGGQQPNLTTITTGNDCGKTQALGFHVQQSLEVPVKLSSDGVTSCALLASPAPTPSPCKASVMPEAASSISARITRAECYSAKPAVTCPPKEDGAGAHRPSALVAWLTAGSLWLVYNFVC